MVPVGSRSTALGAALRSAVNWSAAAAVTWPWLPGAEEITVSHTLPAAVASRWSACMLPPP